MTVGRDDLEANIARVRAEVGDARGGVYGADSLGWEVGRESLLFLGAGCAALLQLAHPFVAHAVEKQSRTREDPLGRFVGTFHYVYRIVFGDLEDAIAAARRVHRMHERVHGVVDEDVGRFARGTRYEALDEPALLWVHATLDHTSIDVFERVVRPLAAREKDTFYRESRRFAALFGARFEHMPASWSAFSSYFDDMCASDAIAVGRPAKEIAHALLHPKQRSLAAVAVWYRVMTAGLLPPKLRTEYGLSFGRKEQRIFDASVRALRAARRATPDALCFVPAYHDAVHRVRGKPGRSTMARTLERAMSVGFGLPPLGT